MPSTVRLVAPTLFMVAMTLRRLSMKVATALATPTPPTSSAVETDQRQELPQPVERARYLRETDRAGRAW